MRVSSKVLAFAVTLLIAFAVVLGLNAQEAKPGNAAQPSRDVRPTGDKPEGKESPRTLNLVAEARAVEQADLHARIAGIVSRVHIDLGDRVQKGQVLAELAVPELEVELTQKKALVVLARAEVEQARRSVQAVEADHMASKAQVLEAEAGIRSSQASYELRKREADRLEKLFAGKSITQEVLDEGRTQLQTARAALAAAEAKLQGARASIDRSAAQLALRQAAIKVAEARLQVAELDVRRVEVQLQYGIIRAPFDGVVTWRSVDTGTFVPAARDHQAQPLFVVARFDRIRVVIEVPEAHVAQVKPEMPVVIRFPGLKGQEFQAKVARLAGILDPKARTMQIEVDLPNPDGKLRPGMSASATIAVE